MECMIDVHYNNIMCKDHTKMNHDTHSPYLLKKQEYMTMGALKLLKRSQLHGVLVKRKDLNLVISFAKRY
jgi:hypothetical protein